MRFLNTIGFLTVIKINPRFYLKKEEFHSTLLYFPAAGLLIGFVSSLIFFSFNFIFPSILTILFIIFFETAITGAIHSDGLADTFDGTFSGQPDKLSVMKIMKKGDIGVFGALSLIFAFAFRFVFYYLLAAELVPERFISFEQGATFKVQYFFSNIEGLIIFALVIIFAPVFGRVSMLLMFSRYEPAVRTASLTSVFKHKKNRLYFTVGLAVSSILYIFTAVIIKLDYILPYSSIRGFEIFNVSVPGLPVLLPAFFYALVYIFITVITVIAAAAAGSYFTKKTGGLSGDIIGAVCVITEILFLLLNYLAVLIF